MADVVKGSVLLTPRFDNLTSTVSRELEGAFGWLIADILENNIAVPQDVLLDAYALLDDEDKEEYAGLIEKRSDTP